MIDQKEVDFIRKWIFPGGFLPTVSFVVDAIRTGSKDRLVVDSISNIGVSSKRSTTFTMSNTGSEPLTLLFTAALRQDAPRMAAPLPPCIP